MSEEQGAGTRHVIQPGPCPPQGCPPPNEIVCIKTKKVYQECKQSEVFELTVYEWDPSIGDCAGFGSENILRPPEGATEVTSCRLLPDYFAFDKCHDNADNLISAYDFERGCCEVRNGRIRFSLEEPIIIPVSLTFDTGQTVRGCMRLEPFDKTVGMSRAGTHPMFKCEVDLWITRCLLCFIEEVNNAQSAATRQITDEVHCCINVVIAFKLFAEVQLLIPAYGFCTPPDCEEVLGECPPAVDDWPPYPPQVLNGAASRDDDGGCAGC